MIAPAEFSEEVDYRIGKTKHDYGDTSLPLVQAKEGIFSCWGWVWYLNWLCGINLPVKVTQAEKLYRKLNRNEPPQFLDTFTYRNPMDPMDVHAGTFESFYRFTHCSKNTNGVARDCPTDYPWSGHLLIYRLRLDVLDEANLKNTISARRNLSR